MQCAGRPPSGWRAMRARNPRPYGIQRQQAMWVGGRCALPRQGSDCSARDIRNVESAPAWRPLRLPPRRRGSACCLADRPLTSLANLCACVRVSCACAHSWVCDLPRGVAAAANVWSRAPRKLRQAACSPTALAPRSQSVPATREERPASQRSSHARQASQNRPGAGRQCQADPSQAGSDGNRPRARARCAGAGSSQATARPQADARAVARESQTGDARTHNKQTNKSNASTKSSRACEPVGSRAERLSPKASGKPNAAFRTLRQARQ